MTPISLNELLATPWVRYAGASTKLKTADALTLFAHARDRPGMEDDPMGALLSRSAWMESLVRLANACFGGGAATWDIVDALRLLLTFLQAAAPPHARLPR